MSPTNAYRFDRDTSVEPTRTPGEYTGEVRDGWSALGGMPNGGYVLGLAMQALRAEMPHRDPLVVSAFFMRRAELGAALLRTEIAHVGRRHSTGSVALVQGGQEVVRATATFTDMGRTRGRTLVLDNAPSLPPTDECVDALGGQPMPAISITERVEYAAAQVPRWLQGEPTGCPHAEFWMSFKDRRPVDAMSLITLADAAAPVVVELGEGSSTVELTVHLRDQPAPGPWVACRASTRHVINGYHEEDFEIWDAQGRLVAQSRQLALLPSSRWEDHDRGPQ